MAQGLRGELREGAHKTGRCGSMIAKIGFSNSVNWIVAWALTVKLLSGECH